MTSLSCYLRRLSKSHLVFALGFLATIFLLIDMMMVFWGAYQAGGSITVGDQVAMLQVELFIIVPISLIWMAIILVRRK